MNAKPAQEALARTPPMGWNSWNHFGPLVDEAAVLANADALVATGLKECGYNYLVVDDCWSDKAGRDADGNLVPDPVRFPNGIKVLADYVHARGMRFGIYSDAAERTCGEHPGSFGYEEQDAQLWADWGVDFLKYDYCFAPPEQIVAIERYGRMGEALRRAGRPILYSLCEWGERAPYLWGKRVGGHMWRVTGDVVDSWVDVKSQNWWGRGIDGAIERAANLAEYAGPGGWNDMDMLVVGLEGKGVVPGRGASFHEYRTQMSMWSMLCSPLMIGCDVRSLTQETADLLMNRHVIAVNQDRLGKQAVRVKRLGWLELWRKPLADGSVAVALLNRGSTAGEIEFTAAEVGLLETGLHVIHDLWRGEEIGDLKHAFALTVLPHDTILLRLAADGRGGA
jgi:alpha-galactosidase